MAQETPNVVSASSAAAPKFPDGVIDIESLEGSDPVSGCRVFTHYNGPTDYLTGLCRGHVRPRAGFDARTRRTSTPRKSS